MTEDPTELERVKAIARKMAEALRYMRGATAPYQSLLLMQDINAACEEALTRWYEYEGQPTPAPPVQP